MKDKYSSGPWHVNGVQIINTPEDADFGATVVAEVCYHSNIPWEANAALIAATPELLHACKALLNCIDPARDWKEAKQARDAIAKATT